MASVTAPPPDRRGTSLRPIPQDAGFSTPQIYGAIAVSALVCATLMARVGLVIDPFGPGNLPLYAALLIGLALNSRQVRASGRLAGAVADGAVYYLLFTAIALIGAIASYPIAAMTRGYADATLQRIDVALHFDWLAWYELVAAHPILQIVGFAAYESIYITPAALLGWFAFHGQRAEAHRFLAGFWIAAIISLALFSLMPAVGPFSYLWHEPIHYMPVSELWQPDLIPALRAHRVHVIDLGQLRGIVSAPSFHAASAILYIATAWRTRPLRWPLICVNVAMLIATPVEGTHYLADMILGAIVAFAALGIARIALILASGEPAGRLRVSTV